MSNIEEIFNVFLSIEDPRSGRNKIHDLVSLIGTSFCAVLSGIDLFLGIEDFVEIHFEELSKYFNLKGGVPSHDTYQRLWNTINPKQFLATFSEFVDNSMVFAQEKVHAKSNEITAILELLKKIDLQGKTITINAIGVQKNICEQIVSENGDYVIALKKNQKNLFEDVELFFENPVNHKFTNENNDKGHGRIEQRIAKVSQDISWLQEIHKWPGLKSIRKVASKVIKKGKETEEIRYYISSKLIDAQELNDIARKHWGIENRLHWRLDVIFNEDKAGIRNDNSAENMNIMRKWALSMLVRAKKSLINQLDP